MADRMAGPIPDAALDQHVAIVGKTGAGKSYAAQGIVERLIDRGERVCVIDPTDRYWGLRLRADGKPSKFEPVIFGGQYADLPLSAAHGAAIADTVGTTTTPVIIATRLMTVGERTRFFTDFAEALLRKNEGPLHLVIDEAHLFMPQAGARVGGAAPAMLHAGNNLVSLGRGIGLRIMLLSQRPAKLHKDALTQAETLVTFRLIAPQDRNAIREWVREWADEATGAEMMASLPSLPTGTAWVWAPELNMLRKGAFPAIVTYDSGKPLAAGNGPALKAIDLAAVRGKLETVAREAVENDPRRLKLRIAELERQLKAQPPADPAAVENAWVEGFKQGKAETSAEYADRMRERQAAIEAALGFLAPYARELPPLISNGKVIASGGTVIDVRTPSTPPTIDQLPRQRQRARVVQRLERAAHNGHAAGSSPAARTTEPSGQLTNPQQKVVDALAWWQSIGVSPASRVQVAIVAGYSQGSGGFNNLLGSLRSANLIDYPSGGLVGLTDAGAALANAPTQAPSTEELQERVYAMLSVPQSRVLRAVVAAYPDMIDRQELGDRTGYSATSGGFNNLLGSLRSLRLINYPGRGHVAAEPTLFING